MNKIKQTATVGNDLIVKYQVSSLIKLEELNKLSSKKSKFLSLYKRFYRLRNMVDSKPYNKEIYQKIIRRKFTMEDFNLKRSILLDDVDILSEISLFERIINTLAFVHNSTVYLPSERKEKPILFFQDLELPQRMEKLIILTLLRMDQQKPHIIKYDRKYEWVPKINNQLNNLSNDPDSKEYKSAFKDVDANLIGFRDYELNLMRLNECYRLCL
ncbi:uncharacterized protein AC631_03203 [Debaryomyces fabryi]|uniref:Increased recombination centers protein 19 n=1 Tax=Debaryomyces fabryi TaxID=58627 RepID=A0A0V1PXN3_9ASCO|nr:uncharacterized protein AC631_03203 [Debaryomyces fabryi]KSA01016.1 hypothetical protein AC631_03203 [Debaryomyces fabryi]CUM50992.1 unnamed protein product [Debaryomyces fabryi]